jgi:hypothetical protein
LIFYRNFYVIEFETKVRLRVGNSVLRPSQTAAVVAWVGGWWGQNVVNLIDARAFRNYMRDTVSLTQLQHVTEFNAAYLGELP